MKISQLRAVYFSPTGTTRKITSAIAKTIQEETGLPCREDDFTLPAARRNPLRFAPHELVIFGMPVYAGRIPNTLLKYLAAIEGHGAQAVPVVVFGNRDYDDALAELRDILQKNGLHILGAAAFVGEHAFSDTLAGNRPDEKDLMIAGNFAHAIKEKYEYVLQTGQNVPVEIKGTPYPYRGYYTPRDRNGNPVDIRKVKPLTRENCNNCKYCITVCPMGSIDTDDPQNIPGICIKCGACIKKCPMHAKYFADPSFLYHRDELERTLKRRAEPEIFL